MNSWSKFLRTTGPLRLFSGVSSAGVEARRFDGAEPSFPVGVNK
jgi:hypothetical protein